MATVKFLDYNGLATLVAKIKTAIATAKSEAISQADDVLMFANQDPNVRVEQGPFTDVVSSDTGAVCFDTANNVFVYKSGTEYYYDWDGGDSYGTLAADQGHRPAVGKLYVETSTGKLYRWDDVNGEMVELATASGGSTDTSAIEADIAELQDAVFPLSVSLTVTPTVILAGSAATLKVTADVLQKGSSVFSAAAVTLNGSTITSTSNSVTVPQAAAVGGTSITQSLSATYDGITKSTSKSVAVVFPSYFGTVADGWSPTATTVKALTSSLQASKAATKSGLSLSNGKIAYAYPKSFGALTSIKDGNNFEVIGSYTLSEVSISQPDGTSTTNVAYYVYLLTDPVTATSVKQAYS